MTMPSKRGLLLSAISGVLALQSVAPATAQTGLVLEVVRVTAQKREQSLQEVPVSVTAFTADVIDRARIDNFTDYAVKTPNVGFQQQGSNADTRFSIRGVTNVGGQASSVGVYVDEVNVTPNVVLTGASRTSDISLLDIERIEVLRGPQGTFFGRNTMGGAINITTVKPDTGESYGEVTLEAGEDDYFRVRGSGNVAISDTLALRGAAYYDEEDGFIDNKGPAGVGNAQENEGARLALRWLPNNDITADFTASYSNMEQDHQAAVPTGMLGEIPSQVVSDGGFLFPIFGLELWPLQDVAFFPDNYTDIATDMKREQENETLTFTANVEVDLGAVTLTSVTGYIDNEFSLGGDGDASVVPAFFVGRDSDMSAFSQEFRLSSNGEGEFNWMIGAIYSDDEVNSTDISTHLASDPYLALWDVLGILEFGLPGDIGDIIANGPTGISVGNFEDVDRGSETTSYAVFTDVTWNFADSWSLGAGLRYTYDEVDYYEVTRPTLTIPVADIRADKDFDDISPRLNLSWLPSDELTVYASVSKGYKVGGFNPNQDLVDLFFEEETGWNYELGLKTALWDNRVQINSAIFYFDWDDLQSRGQDVRTQRQVVVNAESASTQGLELEMTALLCEGLTLGLGYGYLDAEFDTFREAVDTNGNVFDASGNTIPLAPEHSVNASLDYSLALGEGEAYARVDYSYLDNQFTSVDNTPAREIDSYDLWNARIGYDAEHWGAQAFVENLLDEEYSSGTENLETFYTGMQRTVGRGRWAGVRLNVRF